MENTITIDINGKRKTLTEREVLALYQAGQAFLDTGYLEEGSVWQMILVKIVRQQA